MSGLSKVADQNGFIVVFPDGYEKSWNDCRKVGPAAEKNLDDTAYLVALKDEFVAHHHADPHRTYVAGLSNGGMMALTLACRAADHFAGVVAVAGQWSTREECKPKVPISVALMLGEKDPLVPYEGGEVSRDRGPVLSARKTLELFGRLDECPAEPHRSQLIDADRSDGTTTDVDVWAGCAAGTEVRLYTVHNGGHTWPGGWQYLAERWVGKTARDWSASEEIWAFLKDKTR
jgi:polyhydroxybutyrate depolymerase